MTTLIFKVTQVSRDGVCYALETKGNTHSTVLEQTHIEAIKDILLEALETSGIRPSGKPTFAQKREVKRRNKKILRELMERREF